MRGVKPERTGAFSKNQLHSSQPGGHGWYVGGTIVSVPKGLAPDQDNQVFLSIIAIERRSKIKSNQPKLRSRLSTFRNLFLAALV